MTFTNQKIIPRQPTPQEDYIQDFLKGSVSQFQAENFLEDIGYKPSPSSPQALAPNTYILGTNQDWYIIWVMLGEYKYGN